MFLEKGVFIMRFCEKCGAELNDSANFCPNCGYALDGSAADNTSTYADTARTVAGTMIGASILSSLFRRRRHRPPMPPHHGFGHPGPMGGPGRRGPGGGRGGPGGGHRGPGGGHGGPGGHR